MFVVTVVVRIIALTMIMYNVVMSDAFADSKRDRINRVLDKHIEKGL